MSQLDTTTPLPPSPNNPPTTSPWHLQPNISLLFTACLFHDIGTSPHYDTSSSRFEIEGADAAVDFLARFPGIDVKQKREVWQAIALHSTPQIPERMGGLVRLVRLGVAIDFGRPADLRAKEVMRQEGWVEGVEKQFPRGEIEKVLGDAVVEQAVGRPEKAPPACWPGGLYRAKLAEPEWEGVNKAF